MKPILYLLLLTFLILSYAKPPTNENPFPTFLTLTIPILKRIDENTFVSDTERLESSLARWLEASACDLIAIHTWTSYSQIDDLLTKVNGIIFQGNDQLIDVDSSYYKTAQYIYNKVIEHYDKTEGKERIPIVAFGNDLSMLLSFANNNSHLTFIQQMQLLRSTEIELNHDELKNSVIFSQLSEKDYRSLEFLCLLPHELKYSVNPNVIEVWEHFSHVFELIGTSMALNGMKFASVVEGKKYPLFGMAFKPFVVAFSRNKKIEIVNTHKAIKIARFIGNGIVFYGKEMNSNKMTMEEKLTYGFVDTVNVMPTIVDAKYQYLYKRKK
jgi:hypothetical protein